MQFVEALEVRVKIDDKDTMEMLNDVAFSLTGIGVYVFSIVDGDHIKHYYTDFVKTDEHICQGISFVHVAIPRSDHRVGGGFVDSCGS